MARLMRAGRSLPIRIRLALAFAAVMAVVLAATGLFVYERTSTELNLQIDRELEARLAGVDAIIRDDGDDLGDPVQDPLDRVDAQGAVQVLLDDRVVDATSDDLRTEPLVGPAELGALARGGGADELEGPGGPLRIVAGFAPDDGVRYAAIVGASTSERERTLDALARLLLIGGPIALLLSSLAAYGVAAGALRPVDAMRRRAAEITEHDPELRLPVAETGDELSRLGQTLNEMLERLAAALGRERRFVADASHELRTPLTILKAQIELALEEGRSPTELRQALESSGEEVERLNRLADDLLVIARADEGRLPLRPEPVALGALVERVVARFAGEIAGERVAIDIPDSLSVAADPLRLEQVVSNLVDNALRHGGGAADVTARPDGEHVVMTVADRGPGFPPALEGRALERFARSDAASGRGGAGLGLAIVESVVLAHGGSVRIAEREGGGSQVSVSLPAELDLRVPSETITTS
jgi:heavy metal sensor kinase